MSSPEESFEFDAIVVGSGISGGWAAKELTEKGLKVLVLERGRNVRESVDYLGEHMPPWRIPFGGKPLRDLYESEYFIQKASYAFNETTRHYWNNDKKNPYVFDEEKPYHWKRADVVGGKSLLWARQVYRWSDLDFEANKNDGHGIDWPIRYGDIESWYSHVERYIGVSGQAEGLPHLPDGEFLPAMEMNVVEKALKKGVESSFTDRKVTIGRVANLTEPKGDRQACHYCGRCERGCSQRAYFCSLSSTLPDAEKTGNLTLRPDSVVESVVYDPSKKRATGVRVIDANTKEAMVFRSRLVFLCASTIGSTQILLNSKSESFPTGLANRSGVLGRYLMDHTIGNGAVGVMGGMEVMGGSIPFLPGFMDKYPYGLRPTGIYVPRFRNLQGQDEDAVFRRGYGYQGKAFRLDWKMMSKHVRGFGPKFKQRLRKPGPWMVFLGAFGECLPYYENRMLLDEGKRDRYGIPQVKFEFAFRDNENAMQKDIVTQGKEMLKAGGCFRVNGFSMPSVGGDAIHEVGTARMGNDPTESVLNKHNQAHDVPNLFVTDGACMTSSSCVNPSLTFMALTARAVDYAVQQFKAGAV